MSWEEFSPKNTPRSNETITIINSEAGKEKMGFSRGLRNRCSFSECAGVTLLHDPAKKRIGVRLDKTPTSSTIPFPKRRSGSEPVYMSISIKEFIAAMKVELEAGVKRYQVEIEDGTDPLHPEQKTKIISFLPQNGANVVKKGPPRGPKKKTNSSANEAGTEK